MITDTILSSSSDIPSRLIDLCSSSKPSKRASSLASPQIPLPTKKIVIVGDGASGKTSLLHSFARSCFPEDYHPTVFDAYPARVCIGGREEQELVLWDTAGQEDYDRLRPLSYQGAEAALIAFSVDRMESLRAVEERWAPELAHFVPGVPLILVGMKTDLRDTVGGNMIRREDGEAMRKRIGAAGYVECSARLGHNVNEVFLTAVRAIDRANGRRFNRNRRTSLGRSIMKAFACVPLPFAHIRAVTTKD